MSAQTTPIGADAPLQAKPCESDAAAHAYALMRQVQRAPPERQDEVFDAVLRAWLASVPAVVFRLRFDHCMRTGAPL